MNGAPVPASTAAIASPLSSRADPAGTALRNLIWLSGDKVVSVVLGLLVYGLIARHYGPGGAGQFSYGVAVLQAALGLSLVCSSAAVLPRLCQLRDGAAASLAANVFVVRMVGSLFATAVVAIYAVVAIDDPTRRTITLIMLSTVPLLEPFHAFTAYWLSRNQNRAPVLARGSGLLARLGGGGGGVVGRCFTMGRGAGLGGRGAGGRHPADRKHARCSSVAQPAQRDACAACRAVLSLRHPLRGRTVVVAPVPAH